MLPLEERSGATEEFRMWYDARRNNDPTVRIGYAESTDGIHFTKFGGNPLRIVGGGPFLASAIDVKRVGNVLVMLTQSWYGTSWATSLDGLGWIDRGMLLRRAADYYSDGDNRITNITYDQYGHVTPFLLVEGGVPKLIYFGGAFSGQWNQNRIALAHPVGTVAPAAGCTDCIDTTGLNCSEACHESGFGDHGICANPGGTPDACCACSVGGCEGCSLGMTCQEACARAGFSMGECGNPGSVDPSNCCICR